MGLKNKRDILTKGKLGNLIRKFVAQVMEMNHVIWTIFSEGHSKSFRKNMFWRWKPPYLCTFSFLYNLTMKRIFLIQIGIARHFMAKVCEGRSSLVLVRKFKGIIKPEHSYDKNTHIFTFLKLPYTLP